MPPAAAMGGGMAIGGLASVASAGIQSAAARRAAAIQSDAANQANGIQKSVYDQQRSDWQPYQQAGTTALSQMADPDFQRDFTAADFQKDPGYEFRMAEGQKALERGAAARGGTNSGAAMKAIARYGQDFASNEYGNAYNRFNADRDRRYGRLSTLAGYGMNANNAIGAAAQHYGDATSNNLMGAGRANANGQLASGQAWAGAVNNIGQMGMQAGMMGYGG